VLAKGNAVLTTFYQVRRKGVEDGKGPTSRAASTLGLEPDPAAGALNDPLADRHARADVTPAALTDVPRNGCMNWRTFIPRVSR
jgi:hypothetical protein